MQLKSNSKSSDFISFKRHIFMVMLTVALTLSACSSEKVVEDSTHVKIPVKTMMVESEEVEDAVHYIGIVTSGKVVNKSFKVQGRVLEVLVEEGETFTSGQPLMVLEPVDLEYALESAKADYSSAAAQESKAKEAYNFAKNHFEDMKILYDQGAVSRIDFEEAKLRYSASKSDLESASERVKQAKTALDQRQDMQAESILYASFDGQAVNLLVESGEFVNAGYPVIVLSDNKKNFYTGVSQEDVQNIQPGMMARVTINGSSHLGVVNTINSLPDENTRTYQVSIDIEDISYPVGAVGDVDIIIGRRQGIKVPVSSVLSGSVDYVYVVENNMAVKKMVKLEDVVDTNVYVSGLTSGDQLIIEGMKNVKNLSEVNILSE